MGCAFCASTLGGKVRDLTPGEMLEQVLFTRTDSGLSVSNIVLMGIGEPMDNLDNVLKFLELVNAATGLCCRRFLRPVPAGGTVPKQIPGGGTGNPP